MEGDRNEEADKIVYIYILYCIQFLVNAAPPLPPETASDVLPPGGQIIGGPGQFAFTGYGDGIYFTSGYAPHPNLCVTVVNRWDMIDVRLSSSVVNTACTLDPGKTSTCSAQSVSSIDVLCIEMGCNGSGFYRADRLQ